MITARVFVAMQINFSFAVRDDYFKSVLLFKRNPKRQQPQEHGSAHVKDGKGYVASPGIRKR